MKNLLHLSAALFLGLLLASCGRADRMCQLLEQAEWMNQNDSLFTSDSIGKALVRYYDHWWHPAHLRLRAYYMLGCAYRDMGEAPAAIHYYNIATEKADTAHADSATYATLFRIYGQMAMIYGNQNMPEEKKEALSHYGHYAELAHDTLNHVISYEQMTDVCYMLDDTTGIFAYTDSAAMLYRKYGFQSKAASVYPTAIYVCLLNKKYSQARKFMNIFESESGLFDAEGNIAKGREHYYYSKGLYFMSQGEVDSAELYYRKLIPYGYLYEAYKGLLSVYESKNISDSISKYIELTEQALEQWMTNQQGMAIIQSSAMYRYERNQNAAIANARKAERTGYLSIFIILGAVILYGYARKRLLEKEAKMKQLDNEYEIALHELKETENALAALAEERTADKDLIASFLRDKEKLTTHIANLERELLKRDSRKADINLSKTEIVRKFYDARQHGMAGEYKLCDEDWEKLRATVENIYPTFFETMNARQRLSVKDYRTCLLVKAKFTPSDINILMEQTESYSTQTKKRLHKKVFGCEGTAAEFERKVDQI